MTGVDYNILFGNNRIKLNDAEAVFPYEENASWQVRGQRYVDRLEKLAPTPYKRIVDKMPGNFTMVGLIHAILPKARIIHSRRHRSEEQTSELQSLMSTSYAVLCLNKKKKS